MNKLDGKIVLITGSASGIGLACAKLALKANAEMVIVSDNDANKTVGDFNFKSDRCEYLVLDVRSELDWKNAITYLKEKYGRIDVLINNASITGAALGDRALGLESTSLESWRQVHSTNLDGVFLGCKYTLPLLKKSTNASIVNVSSRSGQVGRKDRVAYASSKSAVINFTKSLALDLADCETPIRCNVILPSTIMTKLWAPVFESAENKDNELINNIAKSIPMKRFGEAIEVAKVIIFLASDDASYITGTLIEVDGGASAKDKLRG